MAPTPNPVLDIVPIERTDIPKEVWLRWPDEGPAAFRAFKCYQELPPEGRTVSAAYRAHCEKAGKPMMRKDATARFYIWSKQFAWKERAYEFDVAMEQIELASMQRRRRQNARKRADKIDEAIDILTLPATVAQGKQEALVEQLGKLPAVELLKLLRQLVGNVPELMKADRELLGPAEDPAQAPLAVPTDALRAALANPDTLAVMERVTVMARQQSPQSSPRVIDAETGRDVEEAS